MTRQSKPFLDSLALRLALLYLAIFVLFVAVLVATIYYARVARPLEAVQTSIERELEDVGLTGRGPQPDLADILDWLDTRDRSERGRLPYHVLVAPNGTVISSNLPIWPDYIPGDDWLRFEFETYVAGVHREHEAFVRQIALGNARLLVGRDTEDIDEVEELLADSILWGAGMAILLGLTGGVLISRVVGHRLELIRSAALDVLAGDLSKRIARSNTGDDLDQLSALLNAMLERIERALQAVSRVSDHVAHEVRTPLARLQADLAELAERQPADRPELKTLAENAVEETVRLESMVNALLRIARIEAGRTPVQQQPVDVAALVRDVLDLYEPEAGERRISLDGSSPPGLLTTGDRDLLFQAVTNLLDNALKYTPRGGRISLAARAERGGAAIEVSDTGPGIPAAERPRVTERFYRLQGSSAPGFGLGLSLVQAVAKVHGGSIDFSAPAKGPGLVATLRLHGTRESND